MWFSSLLPKQTSSPTSRHRGQHRTAAPRFRPQLEALEGRCVPSTLKVTNVYDSAYSPWARLSPGTLRYEIAHANAGDTIVFDFGSVTANNTPHTIRLIGGELDITKNLTIQGPGAGLLTVTSAGYASSRIFGVERLVTNANLTGMTISNGNARRFPPTPGMYDLDPYDGAGGGVLNLGMLTISGCNLSMNFAGGGASLRVGFVGGGIANLGTLTVSACTLSNNNTRGYGGGIYNDWRSHATLTGCTLSGNTAYNNGGGIYNLGAMTVSGCTLSGNTALGAGGVNNGAGIGLGGGGIFNSGAITVDGCTLSNNHAQGDGGALYEAYGPATLTNDVVENNVAGFGGHYSGKGGGIFNAYLGVYLDSFTLANTVNNTDVSGTNGSTANIDGSYILG